MEKAEDQGNLLSLFQNICKRDISKLIINSKKEENSCSINLLTAMMYLC